MYKKLWKRSVCRHTRQKSLSDLENERPNSMKDTICFWKQVDDQIILILKAQKRPPYLFTWSLWPFFSSCHPTQNVVPVYYPPVQPTSFHNWALNLCREVYDMSMWTSGVISACVNWESSCFTVLLISHSRVFVQRGTECDDLIGQLLQSLIFDLTVGVVDFLEGFWDLTGEHLNRWHKCNARSWMLR